jgi:hypothetical protein
MLFDLTFNAVQHAASTVGDLRAAVHAMTSRWPTRLVVNGVELSNDKASLKQAGVGLQCSVEIWFDAASAADGSSRSTTPSTAGARPSTTPASTTTPGAAAAHSAAAPVASSSPSPSQADSDRRAAAAQSRMRGGLFHAAMSDATMKPARDALLRTIFDEIDTNRNGVVDRDELAVFVHWASTSDSADPVQRRLCSLFLEDDSLDRSFDRCGDTLVPLPPLARTLHPILL